MDTNISQNHILETIKPQYDIIILVIASHNTLYDKFLDIWKKYDSSFNMIKVFYVYGTRREQENSDNQSNTCILKDSDILVNVEEILIPGILVKTLKSLEFIEKNYNYNFLLRTNLSSFFRLDKLYEHVMSLSRTNVYEGFQGEDFETKIPFISGAGILMSKDIVQLLIAKQSLLNYTLIDDVAIGDFMNKQNIPLCNTGKSQRFDIITYDTSHMPETIIESLPHLHFRIKTKRKRHIIDVNIMKKLYRVFYLKSGKTSFFTPSAPMQGGSER